MKKSLNLKIMDDASDQMDVQLFQVLSGDLEPSMLNIPSCLKWPKGERKATERAIVILRAGFEALQKANVTPNKSDSANEQKIEPKSDLELRAGSF